MDTMIDRTEDLISPKTKPKEGKFTKKVERVTAKVPSVAYLGLAIGSMILSASIAAFSEKKTFANFVGLWVPSLLLIGVYNKLVKIHPTEDAPSYTH